MLRKKILHMSLLIAIIALTGCVGSNNSGTGNNSVTTVSNSAKLSQVKIQFKQQTAHSPVIAYVLLEKGSLDYLNDTLLSQIRNKEVKFNRLVLSFVNPNFSLDNFNAASGNLDDLLSSSGMLSKDQVNPGDGQKLKNIIATLHENNIQVYFAIGGWAYSCYDQNNPKGNCTTNFPLTTDMYSNFNKAVTNPTTKVADVDLSRLPNNVQPLSALTTKQYTGAWTKLAQIYGGNGVDLDYEENWFASEVTYYYGDSFRTAIPTWASTPNGPFILPLSVIKYATYLKELAISSKVDGLGAPTTAAPAPAAYNIHNDVGGAMYWCAVHAYGSALCDGSSNLDKPRDISNQVVAGNLKGLLYDMAHYNAPEVKTYAGTAVGQTRTLNYDGLTDSNGNGLFNGVIDGLDSIDIMTYDLDDGYDTVSGSWCIGKVKGQFSSRDPSTDGYKDVECSIPSQAQTLVEMFKQGVIDSPLVVTKPHLAFGLEAGFPNYPINIDPSLDGGGNEKIADPHYRWNDKFVAFDLPLMNLSDSDHAVLDTLAKTSQTSDLGNGTPDIHSEYLEVTKDLFTRMKNAGADSVILWSLNNADFNQHLATKDYKLLKEPSWDYQQYVNQQWLSFSNAYSKYLYTDVLGILFTRSATPEQMLNIAADNLPQ
jgi:hypothetical protein